MARFPAAALVTPDGELLVSRYQSLADIGALPTAAMTCHQYFQITPQDVAIINDPYSGGSLLSSISLVTGVHFDHSASRTAPSEALLAVRIPFRPRVTLAASVENEGVRIPPTPLVQKGELNWSILEAICAHPMAPTELRARVEHGIETLTRVKAEFGRLKGLTGQSLAKKAAKEWLNHAHERFQNVLSEMAHGSAKGEISLGGKSKLVLSLEVQDQRVVFNFTGSGGPERFALSDAATLGACVGALVASLNANVPLNAGVMRAVDVIAPLGSVVHAKYPAPVFMGFTDGTAAVANLVLKLLGQIDRKLLAAQSGFGQCSFEIDFGTDRHFYDDLEPGAPASRDRRGADALDLWRRTHLRRSVEAIERLFPMRVRLIGVRSQSGGSGLSGGGDGQTKVYEVLAPGRLRWSFVRGVLKADGVLGGKAAIGPEIFVQRAGRGREVLPDFGELQLAPGDQVVAHSSGGGGYGEVPA